LRWAPHRLGFQKLTGWRHQFLFVRCSWLKQEEIKQLRAQLNALATELASLRERIGRSSRNSSKPPSSDGPGFKLPERRQDSGRKRGGQQGHPGTAAVAPLRVV
jgi:hypothetical protein